MYRLFKEERIFLNVTNGYANIIQHIKVNSTRGRISNSNRKSYKKKTEENLTTIFSMVFFVIRWILCGELKWDIIHTAEARYFIICKLYHHFYIHKISYQREADSLYNIGKLGVA